MLKQKTGAVPFGTAPVCFFINFAVAAPRLMQRQNK